ncbi:hypothetical protein MTO96_019937 [Rhipicephalus appendiculatus]
MAAVHLESGASGGEERLFSVPERVVRRGAAGRPLGGTLLTAARLEARTSRLGTRHGREVLGHVPGLPRGRPSVPGGETRARAGGTNCALDASGPGREEKAPHRARGAGLRDETPGVQVALRGCRGRAVRAAASETSVGRTNEEVAAAALRERDRQLVSSRC